MARIAAASLVGAWRLQRWELVREAAGREGTVSLPFGATAEGLLLYTADGWMSATIMAAGRRPLSRANPRAAPAKERAAAFDGYFSYAGRWSVAGGRVRHEVVVALNPAMVGTLQLREAQLAGRELTLSAEEASADGLRRHRLVWRRAGRRAGPRAARRRGIAVNGGEHGQ
jgi:hypothetical protein